VRVHVDVHMDVHVRIRVCVYVYMRVCVHARMHLYMNVCTNRTSITIMINRLTHQRNVHHICADINKAFDGIWYEGTVQIMGNYNYDGGHKIYLFESAT